MSKEDMKASMPIVTDRHLPTYANAFAAGLDLRVVLEEPVSIAPYERVRLHTGLRVQIPEGYFGMVVVRSGLGFRGLTLANAVGIIDSDYRGEIQIGVVNLSDEPIALEDGERIAQMILVPYVQAELKVVEALEETERGEKGFGSSGRM